MKKLISVITFICLISILVCSCTKASEPETPKELLSGKYNIEITIKDYGVIRAELDADSAPITVTNFVTLVKENFYDGLTFHRIMYDFMMQGGASETKSVKTIKGEFESNGVKNPLKHTRGALSMARTNDPNSASSQFFIVQNKHAEHLDGDYAAFGYVTSGMEIVDEICNKTSIQGANGAVLPVNQPVIESIRLID
ncbi:MAG: peptidylprolyl isomerase [Ruminococcaceae bacterium]|nr:peptidylprolyl isomerase [Oscillospiraceae bacterium]